MIKLTQEHIDPLFKELAERMKSISQERDELRNKVGVCEIQLKATSEEKAVTDREFIDSKEEVQSVKNQLLELKENLQVEQKEKEVSKRSKCHLLPSLPLLIDQ